MKKKIILIIAIFILMINLLIGIIYATEGGIFNEENVGEIVEENIEIIQENTEEINEDIGDEKEKIANDKLSNCIISIIVLFIIVLIILERKSSIKILIRLVLSVFALYFIYIKSIVNNNNFLVFTIIIALLLAIINIFLKDGIHRKSFSELVSVIITSFVTSGLISLICKLTNIKGFYDILYEKNDYINIKNNIFGISVIILLGFFMDIISRITLRLDEEKNKTKDINWKEQFKVGNLIGKELISEKINSLLLMFVGIVFIPICIYMNMGYGIFEILKNEQIFIIFVIAFIGNIGLLLSVPITSLIYAMFNRKKTIYKTISDNKIDGKRSLKI